MQLRVLVAEKLVRVKQNMPSWMPTIYINSHSGVRVTLEGTPHQYLIHKGPENSESEYKSVITDARNMRSGWQLKSTKYYNGRVTVQDLINAAGAATGVFVSNCHQAADAMMGL
ncbi:hypothetical protein NQD34_012400 [Periophthalmus magnuspinnatus]|nr:hypothetical protein NQD34_012400 [Periophthalmus magnuspinnatus]